MYNGKERRIRVYHEDENYKMLAEEIDGMVFGHIYIYNYGPAVMRHIKNKWIGALAQAKSEGYTHLHAYTQNPRFVEFLGGAEFINNLEYENRNYEIYRWELKQQPSL